MVLKARLDEITGIGRKNGKTFLVSTKEQRKFEKISGTVYCERKKDLSTGQTIKEIALEVGTSNSDQIDYVYFVFLIPPRSNYRFAGKTVNVTPDYIYWDDCGKSHIIEKGHKIKNNGGKTKKKKKLPAPAIEVILENGERKPIVGNYNFTGMVSSIIDIGEEKNIIIEIIAIHPRNLKYRFCVPRKFFKKDVSDHRNKKVRVYKRSIEIL